MKNEFLKELQVGQVPLKLFIVLFYNLNSE